MFQKILKFIAVHKVISSTVVVVVILVGYFGYKHFSGGGQTVKYVLAAVEKGTIVTSITGSGQVSASNQVDIKAKSSGDVVYVGVKNGQEVRAGAILAQLDARDAQQSVRDAQIGLESSQIALEKLRHNQESGNQTTVDDLSQSYKDAYNKVSDAFLKLPDLLELSRSVLYDNNVAVNGCGNDCEYSNLLHDSKSEFGFLVVRTENDYKSAKSAYDPNFLTYRDLRIDATPADILVSLDTTEKTTELMAQAIKSEQNMLDTLVSDINDEAAKGGHKGVVPQQVITYQNNIASATSDINSIILSLNNAKRAIDSAQRSLDDSTLTNPIDIRSQENTVAQREASLQDAKLKLSDAYIRAPFAGVVAAINVKKGDSVGSTAVATMISKQKIAEVSLNEVDVAKVKVGEKATLTFDAVESLTITGEVYEIDTIGTVSQGVVSYNVKIGFDTQDERIKPGMSVSSAIITDSKQDVLLVPNSAVKASGGTSYVEMPQDPTAAASFLASSANIAAGLQVATTRQTIELGLASDTVTEVTNGLKEGDLVVIRTVSSTNTAATQSSTNSLFGGAARTGGTTRAGGTFQQRTP